MLMQFIMIYHLQYCIITKIYKSKALRITFYNMHTLSQLNPDSCNIILNTPCSRNL